MFAVSTLLLSTIVIALAQPAGTDKAAKHLEILQGKWEMERLEINGKQIGQTQIGQTYLNIRKNDYRTTVKGKELAGFRMKLDPTKDPHWVDMVQIQPDGSEKTLKGIYKLDNDKLWICRAAAPEQERPSQFATWPDTGYFVVTWRRVK